jgi:palmitoyltransferase
MVGIMAIHLCILKLTLPDPSKPWPPPDPDRMFRAARKPLVGDGFTQAMDVESFRARQTADMARYEDMDGDYVVRRRPFHERLEAASRQDTGRVYELDDDYEDDQALVSDDEPLETPSKMRSDHDDAGEEAWRNKEGERLADFGVDEVADFYDEDDLPLAELLRRRQAAQ